MTEVTLISIILLISAILCGISLIKQAYKYPLG